MNRLSVAEQELWDMAVEAGIMQGLPDPVALATKVVAARRSAGQMVVAAEWRWAAEHHDVEKKAELTARQDATTFEFREVVAANINQAELEKAMRKTFNEFVGNGKAFT